MAWINTPMLGGTSFIQLTEILYWVGNNLEGQPVGGTLVVAIEGQATLEYVLLTFVTG